MLTFVLLLSQIHNFILLYKLSAQLTRPSLSRSQKPPFSNFSITWRQHVMPPIFKCESLTYTAKRKRLSTDPWRIPHNSIPVIKVSVHYCPLLPACSLPLGTHLFFFTLVHLPSRCLSKGQKPHWNSFRSHQTHSPC